MVSMTMDAYVVVLMLREEFIIPKNVRGYTAITLCLH